MLACQLSRSRPACYGPLPWLALLISGDALAFAVERTPRFAVGVTLPVYAYVVLNGAGEPKGLGAGAEVRLRLSDTYSLHGSFLWTGHALEDEEPSRLRILSAMLGLGYRLDLAVLAPIVEFAAGLLHRSLGDSRESDLGFRAGVSSTYWWTSWLGVGASLYYYGFASDPTDIPVYVTLGPHILGGW